jgi:hypothetical protein
VTKVSEAYVAVMAQQASDVPSIVAVIDVKVSAPPRLCCLADRAFAVLRGQQTLVLAERNAVRRSQFVVFGQAWVSFSPLARVLGHSRKILFAPAFVTLNLAGLAVNLKAVHSMLGFEELVRLFEKLAPRAGLSEGYVETGSRHGALLCV